MEEAIAELISQIEHSDYKDSLGHEIKCNRAYIEIKELIEA